MTRVGTTLAIVAMLAPISSSSSYAGGTPPTDPLDGKSFEGEIRGTGLLRLLGSEATLEFENGFFSWTKGDDFEPAPYETTEAKGKTVFTARAVGREGGVYAPDRVEWSGVYDGESLSDVEAVWRRSQGGGDWLHDLLLPEVVTFVFTQK